MSRAGEWSRAFAIQAASDLAARDVLIDNDLPPCHQLHYLQMACEKVSKAYLYSTGADEAAFRTSHAYVAKILPLVAKFGLESESKYGWALTGIRHLARQIELLAPAVDDGGRRPDNCEYPWLDGNDIQIPAERSFPNLSMLEAPAGVLMLKAVTTVAGNLSRRGTGKAET